MLKKIVWGVALCLLSGSLAMAQETTVEFEGRYWMTNLSADTKVIKSDKGTDVDFKSDLGLGDKNFLYGRFTFNLNPANRLIFTYTPINYNADTHIKRTIEFGGQTYPVNARVIGDLSAQYMRLGWAWQFINLEGGRFKFGTLLEVKYILGDISLAAPDLGTPIKEAWCFKAGLPALGFALDVNPVPFLNFFAEASGFSLGQYGYMWEAEAGVKFVPYKYFSLSGGFRILDIEARNDPDYAKIRLAGPYMGLSLRF